MRNHLLLLLAASSQLLGAGDMPADWQFEQPLLVPQAGLLKVTLPAETLGAARAGLEDLRLLDPAGRELPYVIERPEPPAPLEQRPKSFAATLSPDATVLLLETGLTAPVDGVDLSTPAPDLLKAVRVESSDDRRTWRIVIDEAPVFRQAGGLSQLRVALPRVTTRWLRVTIDDRRSAPVPFTGATLSLAPPEHRTEVAAAILTERTETPGESRLRATLPAAHLPLATVELEVSDPVFSRPVTVSSRQVIDGTVREAPLAQGTVFRLAFESLGAASNLLVTVDRQVPSRELAITIANQNSPPLAVSGVRVRWRPTHLVFRAAEPGTYRILVGNRLCAAPRYDLAALSANLRALAPSPLQPGALRGHSGYRPPPTLPTVADQAAALDTAAWKFRCEVQLSGTGAHQLELPLPVLAGAQAGLADLRLLRDTNQVPFILDADFAQRSLAPAVRLVPDPKRPRVSRWQVTLPHARLPLARLTCSSSTPLFHRQIALFEERTGERGDHYPVTLGSGTWTRTPQQTPGPLSLAFTARPETDTLWIETDNGDNPPLQLDRVEVTYAASRVLFKSEQPGNLWLYYGNPQAGRPRYDLSLVADQLVAAEKQIPALGAEQRLQAPSWQEQFGPGGRGGPLIWGVLIGVVVALLIVVKRLVPPPAPPGTSQPPV